MQGVLGYSPIETGFAFLATAGTTIPAAGIAQAIVTRVGVKPVMTTGLTLTALAYLAYTRLPVEGHYWTDLFVPYVISGFGLAFTFIPLSLAALASIEDRIAGVGSGLLNTSQQIGGALGVAIISTVTRSHSETLLKEGKSQAEALTGGYHWGFWVACAFATTGALVAGLVLRRGDVPVTESAHAAAPG
jgi:MFS family permease